MYSERSAERSKYMVPGAAAGRKRVVGAPLVAFGDPDTVGATPREKLVNRAGMSSAARGLDVLGAVR